MRRYFCAAQVNSSLVTGENTWLQSSYHMVAI